MPVRCSGWKRVTFLAVILACSHVQHAYSRLGGLVFMGDESRFQQQSLIDPWIEVSLCSIYIHPLCWQMCKYCLCCILENLFWEVFMVESRCRIYFCHGRREVKMGSSNLRLYIYASKKKWPKYTDPGSIAICWICKPNWALFVAFVMLQMLNSTSLADTKMLHLITN